LRRKGYLIREETIKHNLKRIIVKLLITSLQNNIKIRRDKIENIHSDMNKAQKN